MSFLDFTVALFGIAVVLWAFYIVLTLGSYLVVGVARAFIVWRAERSYPFCTCEDLWSATQASPNSPVTCDQCGKVLWDEV